MTALLIAAVWLTGTLLATGLSVLLLKGQAHNWAQESQHEGVKK